MYTVLYYITYYIMYTSIENKRVKHAITKNDFYVAPFCRFGVANFFGIFDYNAYTFHKIFIMALGHESTSRKIKG